jgi:phage repressor protein C with HTH and peptisase S24 domain
MRLGIFLRKLRENLPMTQQEAAQRAGLSLAGVSRLERIAEALDDVHAGTLTQLAAAYGFKSREELVERFRTLSSQSMAANHSARHTHNRGVPIVGEVPGGAVAETIDTRHTDANHELPLPLEWFPGAVATRVRGSSMSPKYNDGDWVVTVQTTCETVRTGQECYVELADGGNFGGTLKKIIPQDHGRLLLLPINDGEHDPIHTRSADVRLIRRAVGKYVPYARNFGFDTR